MCRLVRMVAREVTDGRKSLPGQVHSSPQAGVMSVGAAGVMSVGVVHPEANDPHGGENC